MSERNYWQEPVQRRRLKRRSALAAGVFGTGALALLGACGGSTKQASPTAAATSAGPRLTPPPPPPVPSGAARAPATSAPAAGTTPRPAAVVQPKRGGAIVLGDAIGDQPHHDVDLATG